MYHLKIIELEQMSRSKLEEIIKEKESRFNEIKYDTNITTMRIYNFQNELNQLYKLREKIRK